MKVIKTTHVRYCHECDSESHIVVMWENPQVIQNDGFALCDVHAAMMAGKLSDNISSKPQTCKCKDCN